MGIKIKLQILDGTAPFKVTDGDNVVELKSGDPAHVFETDGALTITSSEPSDESSGETGSKKKGGR